MGTDKRARQKANRQLGRQQAEQAQNRRRVTRIAVLVVGGIAVLVLGVWIASTILGDDEPTTPDVTVPATVPADNVPADTVPADTVPATTGG